MVMYNQLLDAHMENIIAALHASAATGPMVSIGQTLSRALKLNS